MRPTLDRSRFLAHLSQLISLADKLQNAPAAGLLPRERLAAETVLERLAPHLHSGRLVVRELAAPGCEDRPSLVITLPGTEPRILGLVGAHFDVVPADRQSEGWHTDPFRLIVDSDGTLRGRGVTDCLGHVALLTEMLRVLAERPELRLPTVMVVLIANEEEAEIAGVGLPYVVEQGCLEPLRRGSLFWLDSADFGPTLGTGGIAMWEIEACGVGGHSGMPHNCVNALELATAAATALGRWFHERYPAHRDEARWRFASPSSFKMTTCHCANQKITMIPSSAHVQGDVRLTPFYDMGQVWSALVDEVHRLDTELGLGHQLPGFPRTRTSDGRTGSIRISSRGRSMEGIACDLNSRGLAALNLALETVRGKESLRPWSMTGSLPLVADLQRHGFDVQITGFGESASYHAPNEQGKLTDFEDGFAVLWELVTRW